VPVKFIVDGAALDEVLRGPDGPVVRFLTQRADAAILGARAQLEPHKKSGRLARSIVKRFYETEQGVGVMVVAGAGLKDPNYAYWVHEGNGPRGSRITPKKSAFLVFEIDGRKIFVRSVRTSTPIPYLRDQLKLFVTA
jgi:hypothetical protein